MERQTSEEVQKNITRVKASITIARLLALEGVAFRGHDETEESSNRGNFIEFLQLLADHNEEIGRVALDKAPPYAKYTSHEIQKQILHVLAKKVRNHIFEEVGNYKYSIIVDEASDESSHEQMAIVLRFVDANGLIQERFFSIVHVENTTSKTLYSAIRSILSFYKFPIQNLRGQGYDGASNMRGEWNGLQALFLKDSPQAYYVHCMAHRLQLSLVAASYVFNAAIDVQMTKLGSRFNDRVVELLKLSSSLNPRDGFKTFDIDAICKLAREYYPLDFSDDDIDTLKFQLKMFQVNIPNYPSLEKLSSITDLCKELASTRLGKEYNLIDRLIRLLLTLPVSTATGERAFSAKKIVKNRLRNKMNDDFLADSLVIFIKRMIAKNFRLDDILSDFVDLKEHRVLFK
ncbi:unnamed protein product [Linum tenue]|uniref:Zinc finger MYM-type protein 1-like n=1 Tax=Linum tenue TaxID=586396 RepID=A0AAV0NQT5_9ROSI|nr:unnamed protein product [Linum tenue]